MYVESTFRDVRAPPGFGCKLEEERRRWKGWVGML